MSNNVLILGSTGRFGRNCSSAFRAAGWAVRDFDRSTDDLATAAQGIDVIVNGWNPAYTDWAKQVPDLTEQIISVAKISGATVMIPGNVYNYGKNAPSSFSEATRHGAQNHLGKIRIDMEASYRRSGVPTIVIRAGDFLDTQASGNWFDLVMTKNLHKGDFEYPGNPDIPHSWAYLPDLAQAFVRIAENRASLAQFEDIPFPGYTLTGRELCQEVERASARELRLKKMNWLPIRLVSPFWAMGRRLIEMSYLWNKPHQLDGRKFNRLLPDFEPTTIDTAVAQAVSANINPDQTVVGRAVTA